MADDIKSAFFFLLSDSREWKRNEAYELLASSVDSGDRLLAEAGKTISEVICKGADPKTLENAISVFGRLQMSDYWHAFMETAGDVLLTKALSEEEGSQHRSQLIGYALRMVAMAQNGGFPVADLTIESVRRAKISDPAHADAATAITRMNAMLKPQADESIPKIFRKKGWRLEKKKSTVG